MEHYYILLLYTYTHMQTHKPNRETTILKEVGKQKSRKIAASLLEFQEPIPLSSLPAFSWLMNSSG